MSTAHPNLLLCLHLSKVGNEIKQPIDAIVEGISNMLCFMLPV